MKKVKKLIIGHLQSGLYEFGWNRQFAFLPNNPLAVVIWKKLSDLTMSSVNQKLWKKFVEVISCFLLDNFASAQVGRDDFVYSNFSCEHF